MSAPLARHVAVVGSGPAGFYAAAGLLGISEPEVYVDMLERLPTPWGLVRSGVAPDHAEIKSVGNAFGRTAMHERFRFFGNVELGRHVSREELLARYDAVVYATGAPRARTLGIPGEDLPGTFTAAEVVGWYNGHPDHHRVRVAPHLRGRRAVIVGNGNVALDVARMLTKPVDDLASTDIADHALDALRSSRLRSIVVVGRRGPLQASFTSPELRELARLDGVGISVDPAELGEHLGPGSSRARRNIEVLRDFARAACERRKGVTRSIELRFNVSPVEVEGDMRVRAIVLARNRLHARPDGTVVSVDTGIRERLPTDLVISTIGYKGEAIQGLPFDPETGTVPHTHGRVRGTRNEYVVGWIKRGPSGVIGTNKKCAQETVSTLTNDVAASAPVERGPEHREYLARWFTARQPQVVTLDQWNLIDAHERALGEPLGRPRVKLCTTSDLIRAGRAQAAR